MRTSDFVIYTSVCRSHFYINICITIKNLTCADNTFFPANACPDKSRTSVCIYKVYIYKVGVLYLISY